MSSLQTRVEVFDEAAQLLLAEGLRDYPFEFAEAITTGDMHSACILSRRLSAACRNIRVPAKCNRWEDPICRNHLLYASAQNRHP